jgi:hypothetical protein
MSGKFSLESVLEHRRRQEEDRVAKVALAEIQLEQARASAQLAISRHQSMLADLDALKAAPSLDGLAIMATQQQVERAQTAVLLAQEKVRVAAQAVATLRTEAVRAGQDRLAIERLRDNFYLNERRDQEHAEAERLGEIALMRWHLRNTSEGGPNQ